MSKFIAVVGAGLFAAGTMLAADPNQCAQQIAECKASSAKLDIANKPVLQHALDNYGRGDAP